MAQEEKTVFKEQFQCPFCKHTLEAKKTRVTTDPDIFMDVKDLGILPEQVEMNKINREAEKQAEAKKKAGRKTTVTATEKKKVRGGGGRGARKIAGTVASVVKEALKKDDKRRAGEKKRAAAKPKARKVKKCLTS